jgi:predicted nucleic acid-binding protein
VRNALLGYVRRGQLELVAAQRLMGLAERALVRGERQVESRRVLELASSSGRSAYDCEYAALAEAEGLELVTDDGQVLQSFPGLAVPMVEA